MSRSSLRKPICIYGVPMDLGQNRRGVDMGPSAIRYAGLQARLQQLGWDVRDGGNITVPNAEEVSVGESVGSFSAFHAETIANVSETLHQQMRISIEKDEYVIVLGGDHSVALGSLAAALHWSDRVGVIWVDAHGDFNTPQTSPSGNVHGMVVRSLMGQSLPGLAIGDRLLRADQIVMIGIRDLDSQERIDLRNSGIHVTTMRDIDEKGIAAVVQAALDGLGGVDAIHISFDLDSLDPTVAPGVGTPVAGGLNYREAHLLMEMLADDGRVRSLDLVEVNPILDTANQTAKIAVDLAASLFGQRIL